VEQNMPSRLCLCTEVHVNVSAGTWVLGITQVWLPKSNTTQTTVGRGQSMAKNLRHILGARGPPGVPLRTLNVILDLGQPQYPLSQAK
jgi:hypothetical protein